MGDECRNSYKGSVANKIFSMDHASVAQKTLLSFSAVWSKGLKPAVPNTKSRHPWPNISAHSYPFHSLSLSLSLALSKLISFHTILSISPYHLLSSVSCIHSFGKDSSVSVYKHYPSKNHSCKLQIALPSLSLFLRLSINRSQVCEAYVMVILMHFWILVIDMFAQFFRADNRNSFWRMKGKKSIPFVLKAEIKVIQ